MDIPYLGWPLFSNMKAMLLPTYGLLFCKAHEMH